MMILSTSAFAQKPLCIVTIKPLKGLVSELLKGIYEVEVLFEKTSDPHHASITPGMVKQLEKAELIVWVGADFEHHASNILNCSKFKDKICSMESFLKSGNVSLLPPAVGKNFVHNHHCIDGHYWLYPPYMKLFISNLAEYLGNVMHPNKNKLIHQRKLKILKDLDALNAYVKQTIRKQTKPLLMFHDSLNYWRTYYGLNVLGSITSEPSVQLRPRHIELLRENIPEQTLIVFENGISKNQIERIEKLLKRSSVTVDFLGDTNYLKCIKNLAKQLVN